MAFRFSHYLLLSFGLSLGARSSFAEATASVSCEESAELQTKRHLWALEDYRDERLDAVRYPSKFHSDEEYQRILNSLLFAGLSKKAIGEAACYYAYTDANLYDDYLISPARLAIFENWLMSITSIESRIGIRAGWLHCILEARQNEAFPSQLHTAELISAIDEKTDNRKLSVAIEQIKKSGNWQAGDLEKVLTTLELAASTGLREPRMSEPLTHVFATEFDQIGREKRHDLLAKMYTWYAVWWRDEIFSLEKFKLRYRLSEEDLRDVIRRKALLKIEQPQNAKLEDPFHQILFRPYLLDFSSKQIANYLTHKSLTNFPDLVSLWTHYGFNDPQFEDLAVACFSSKDNSPILKRNDSDISLADYLGLSERLRRKIAVRRFLYNPQESLAILAQTDEVPNPIPAPILKKIFNQLEAEGLIPARSVELMFDGGRLHDGNLNLALFLDLTRFREALAREPRNIREVLAWKFGLNEASLQNCRAFEKSQSFLKEFYVILSEITDTLGESPFGNRSLPALQNIKDIDFFLNGLEQFKSYLVNYHSRYYFGKSLGQFTSDERIQFLKETVGTWPIDERSSLEDIQTLTKFYQEKNFTLFADLLTQNGSSLTLTQLKKLESEWGDMSALLILASRLRGIDFIQEIARIFEASLQGNFAAYKFTGRGFNDADVQAAKAQTRGLKTEQQQAAWAQDYARLKLVTPKDFDLAKVIANEERSFQSHIDTSLFPNLAHAHIAPVPISDTTKKVVLATLLNRRDNPTVILNELRAVISENVEEADAQILWSVLEEFRLPYHPEQSPRLATQLNAMMTREDSHFLIGNAQLKSDLRTIMDLPKARAMGAQKESIVVTLTTSHPKLLLLTGDLVDCGSCQNYRTGSIVSTLLGYVKDANVKLVLSQNIAPGDLLPKDYAALKQAIEANHVVDVQIDPRDLSLDLRFTDLNGGVVKLKTPARKFYRRHVLKLGTTAAGEAGLALERAYTQVLPAQETMEVESLRMLHHVAHKTGARTGEAIKVTLSGAPGGQYSDAAGGVQLQDYPIPADPKQK